MVHDPSPVLTQSTGGCVQEGTGTGYLTPPSGACVYAREAGRPVLSLQQSSFLFCGKQSVQGSVETFQNVLGKLELKDKSILV